MNAAWIATIAVIIINIFGWGFTFGKLNGRIKTLEETTQRHEKVLNDGVVQELSGVKSQLANLEGTIKTYIEITEKSKA